MINVNEEIESTAKKKITAQLKGMTMSELRELVENFSEKSYRADQIFSWMYNHMVTDFDAMLNIPKNLRILLKNNFQLSTLSYIDSEISTKSGTKKYIFKTNDENVIESVIIPEGRRTTLCISTQVGCPLDCKFCATGLMGYKKNLTAGEIFDQYLLANKDYGKDRITNIVYMGMGEPLLNFNETLKTLRIFAEEKTVGISLKKINVSTVGITPKIYELANSGLNANLALSLHSCIEEVRSKIMPINKKYPLKGNIEAIKYYQRNTKTRITFEYVMLNEINDRNEDLKELVKLCSQLPCKVNVIPFNSLDHMNPGGLSAKLKPTPKHRIDEFVKRLRDKNITVTVRFTQGDDIAAACGQLAVKY
jgi:23S rRNA (adenine2503-C2)-methyltransferase